MAIKNVYTSNPYVEVTKEQRKFSQSKTPRSPVDVKTSKYTMAVLMTKDYNMN